MNPFDHPPAGDPVISPVSAITGTPAPDEPPRRGRMALVALLTAGLVGGGIAGISALVSADRPESALPAAAPDDESTDATTDAAPAATDATTDAAPVATDVVPGATEPTDEPAVDGELEFDLGNGEPIVIDLGDLDRDAIGRFNECIGLPSFDVMWGEPGEFETGDLPFGDVETMLDELFGADGEFGDVETMLDELFGDPGRLVDGGSVTVAGPDGVSVVDLGEDGSVTVTKRDGDVQITTTGDATVSDLGEIVGDVGRLLPRHLDEESGDPEGDLQEWLDQWVEDFGSGPGPGGFEPIDPAAVQACVDEVLGD